MTIMLVGMLTYSEQKLLNRIRTKFLKARNIKQVEEYINDLLLKSATFDLAWT